MEMKGNQHNFVMLINLPIYNQHLLVSTSKQLNPLSSTRRTARRVSRSRSKGLALNNSYESATKETY